MPARIPTPSGMTATILAGTVTDAIAAPDADGLTCDGREHPHVEIADHVFDFRGIPPAEQDEILSGVAGASVVVRRCLLVGGIKAILAGNGDHPAEDYGRARWRIMDSVIMDCGRRCPEAQDGALVHLERCWIHGWGRPFDVRSFGAWAHRGAVITARNCLFTQPGGRWNLGVVNTLRDCLAHAGQAVNDRGLRALLHWRNWAPGVTRGLTAATGGITLATNCWTNRRWIRLDGCNSRLSDARAKAVGLAILAGLPPEAQERVAPLRGLLTEMTA